MVYRVMDIISSLPFFCLIGKETSVEKQKEPQEAVRFSRFTTRMIEAVVIAGITLYGTVQVLGVRIDQHEKQIQALSQVASNIQVIAERVAVNRSELDYRRDLVEKIPGIEKDLEYLKDSNEGEK